MIQSDFDMKLIWRVLFWGLFGFFVLHTVRDVLQILQVHNFLADFYTTHHIWCGQYCDYVGFPPELFGLVGSAIVLRRNKVGWLGYFILISLIFWPMAVFSDRTLFDSIVKLVTQ